MSNKSNDNGRAYEFAFINELGRIATQNQNINIEKNSSYYVVEKSWNTLSDVEKEKYTKSAITGINLITSLEPIIEDGNGVLNLKIQADNKGELGDVRDILIQRENINWEIGLSLKHNHFAVKHSRLSHKIDFSEKWFQLPSSQNYWDNIIPIFEKLEIYKKDKIKWRELSNKEDDIYYPILKSFIAEIKEKYDKYNSIVPQRMVEYLLGYFDFYKIISQDNKK